MWPNLKPFPFYIQIFQTKRITEEFTGPARIVEIQILLEKEIQLLNGIESRRSEIQKEMLAARQDRILARQGDTVKWIGYKSEIELLISKQFQRRKFLIFQMLWSKWTPWEPSGLENWPNYLKSFVIRAKIFKTVCRFCTKLARLWVKRTRVELLNWKICFNANVNFWCVTSRMILLKFYDNVSLSSSWMS